MMLALVIVAGSAFAAPGDREHPYLGGTYSYTLTGITLTGAATAVITYSGTAGGIILPADVSLTAGAAQSLPFSVTYGATTGAGDLTVTITYNAAGGCANHISLAIAPATRPTFTLAAITSAGNLCQVTTGTTNNVAASSSGSNTIDYTITPTSAASGYTYDYTLTLSPANINGTSYTVTNVGSNGTGGNANPAVVSGASGVSIIRVTFNTTAGAQVDLAGTLTAGTLHVASAEGGGTISCTGYGTAATKTIGALPVIGTFTLP